VIFKRLYLPQTLTFKTHTFCPHRAFMFIQVPYHKKWLFRCTTSTDWFLCLIHSTNWILEFLQAVNRWRLTAENRVPY